MRKACLLIALMFLSVSAWAALPVTQGLYVGAISINPSQDAKILADWYAQLGIATKELGGGYYAKLDTASGMVAFAIHPKKADATQKSSVSISVTFHVEDFDASLAAVKGRGLTPEKIETDPFGRFAHFHDPDGNEVTLWGK
jgi:glyoxylase I family protein